MKYSIPTNKLEKLEKIIKKYQKKGALINFQIGNKVTEKGTLYINDDRTHKQYNMPIEVECYEVFVDGTYIINGWQFVGTVEFTENGNIIRLADSSFEGKIPVKYLHTPKICEHCGKIRNRKDTYLVCSTDGDFKQVGSSCLLDYTHGLDADNCASIMSCLDQVKSISNKDYDFSSFVGKYSQSTGLSIDNSTAIKALAIGLVRAHGYVSKRTAEDLSNLFFHNFNAETEENLFGDVEQVSEEEVEKVNEYAKDYFDSTNDYMRNASLAWCKDCLEYRDFGLIASFASVYLKDMQHRRERLIARNNEYVGNIGDKITFKVACARVLYIKDNSMYSYYADSTKVWEIIDTKNHTYKWSASYSIEINSGDVITATIKDHAEYKGLKQTVITRGKITK